MSASEIGDIADLANTLGIKRGKLTFITGPTGSGKTVIAQTLERVLPQSRVIAYEQMNLIPGMLADGLDVYVLCDAHTEVEVIATDPDSPYYFGGN